MLEKGLKRFAIEIKLSTSPQVKRGFWQAIKDIQATDAFVIAPVNEPYHLKEGATVISPLDFIHQVLKSI